MRGGLAVYNNDPSLRFCSGEDSILTRADWTSPPNPGPAGINMEPFATPHYSPVLFASICIGWAIICGFFGCTKIFWDYDKFQEPPAEEQ